MAVASVVPLAANWTAATRVIEILLRWPWEFDGGILWMRRLLCTNQSGPRPTFWRSTTTLVGRAATNGRLTAQSLVAVDFGQSGGRHGKLLAQVEHFAANPRVQALRRPGALSAAIIQPPIRRISPGPMPRVVRAGVPMRMPRGIHRLALVVGDHVLVDGDAAAGRAPASASLPPMPSVRDVDQHQVVVGAAADQPHAAGQQRLGQRLGVVDDRAGRSA